jgi:DNA-binding MarR family transcriptional regulator
MSTMVHVDPLYGCWMAQDRTGEDAPPPRAGLAFEGGTGFLLSRAGALARRSWTQMLTERGLSPHQYGMLMALGELRHPCGQQQLSELIGIDPRNAVPIVDVLVDKGLLGREIDPNDRRRRLLALTTAGRDMVHDLTTTGAHIETRFLQALDPDDRKELHRILLALLAPAIKQDIDQPTT